MTPHLVKWHNELASSGLTVIEVDNGDRDSLADLETHIQEAGVTFPVFHDDGGQLCNRFGVGAYPTAYLIGRDGKVLWEGHPDNEPSHRQMIEQALALPPR